jgi:hypothetical protein
MVARARAVPAVAARDVMTFLRIWFVAAANQLSSSISGRRHLHRIAGNGQEVAARRSAATPNSAGSLHRTKEPEVAAVMA